MFGKMLPGSGNSVARPMTREEEDRQVCILCLGTGTIPWDINNLDDDRERDCPMCSEKGR